VSPFEELTLTPYAIAPITRTTSSKNKIPGRLRRYMSRAIPTDLGDTRKNRRNVPTLRRAGGEGRDDRSLAEPQEFLFVSFRSIDEFGERQIREAGFDLGQCLQRPPEESLTPHTESECLEIGEESGRRGGCDAARLACDRGRNVETASNKASALLKRLQGPLDVRTILSDLGDEPLQERPQLGIFAMLRELLSQIFGTMGTRKMLMEVDSQRFLFDGHDSPPTDSSLLRQLLFPAGQSREWGHGPARGSSREHPCSGRRSLPTGPAP